MTEALSLAPPLKSAGNKRASTFFQPKLSINHPGDKYEQEADAVADKVMRMQKNVGNDLFFKPAVPTVQLKCAECEEEEKKAQRKETNDEGAVADDKFENYVSNLAAGGEQLPKEVRSFYEPRFQHDFSNVKVHTDSVAAKSAQSINALAYTSGSNIVFNSGQYSPNTDSGKRLLAHELTHVVQQSGGHNNIQCDFATEMPNAGAVAPELTDEQIADAIQFNQRTLRDADEIMLIRDVIGLSHDAPLIDADFVQSVATFQAEQNLTADGKIGSLTSSRLSRELHAEGRYLGSGTAEGRPLEHSARRMDVRSMHVGVTTRGVSLSNTGSADYQVVFRIPDRTANGWIIQHHRRTPNVTDCTGTAVAPRNGPNEYWEAWQVVNGVVQAGPASNGPAPANLNDEYRTINENPNTRGTISLTGRVVFMPTFVFVPADWAITAVGVHPAGILPHRNTAPRGWSDAYTVGHNMTITYDACVAAPRQTVTTVP